MPPSPWTLALAAAVVLAAVVPVAAQSPAKPAPCAGVTATDPAADQRYYVPAVNQRTDVAAPAQTDLTAVFFNAEGNRMTANLQLAEVAQTVPAPLAGLRFTLYYLVGGRGYYVRAVQTSSGVTYTHGTNENIDGQALQEVGPAQGSIHPGTDGVVQWVLPAGTTGSPGQLIRGWAATAVLLQGPNGSPADYMPDGAGAADGPRFTYAGAPCPQGPGGQQPTPTATATTGATATPTPTPQPTAGPSDTLLQVSVSPTRLRAAKVRRSSRLAFHLTSRESVTNLVIELRRGSRVLARGRVRSLSPGKRRVTLRLRRRGLKKGSHALVLRARRPDGSQTGVTHVVRVR